MKESQTDDQLLAELGISRNDIEETFAPQERAAPLNPWIAAGLSTFLVANVAMLLSLPPVLRGKGAPYLPTWSKSMDAMFSQLRQNVSVILHTLVHIIVQCKQP
jgi:hypothetical protein